MAFQVGCAFSGFGVLSSVACAAMFAKWYGLCGLQGVENMGGNHQNQ